MATVKILVRPSGCLNLRPWPEVGEVIDLPDSVAEGMIANGHVEAVASKKVEKRPAPTAKVEKRG